MRLQLDHQQIDTYETNGFSVAAMPIDDGETAEVLRMCGIVRAASRSEDRELTEICQMLEAAAAGGRLPPPTAMVRYEELIRELYARKGKLAGSISRAGHRWLRLAPEGHPILPMLRHGWSEDKVPEAGPVRNARFRPPETPQETAAMQAEIRSMEELGVCTDSPLDHNDSRIEILHSRLVKKLDGSYRHVLCMDERKDEIERRSFQSSAGNVTARQDSPRDGWFMLAADQSKAFWQLWASMTQSFKMHFFDANGRLKMMLSMAMGFVTASEAQSLVNTGFAAILESLFGYEISCYADEYRTQQPSKARAFIAHAALVMTGSFLGMRFGLGVAKSMLDYPTTRLDHIGLTFDTTNNSVAPMQARWTSIQVIAVAFLRFLTGTATSVPMPADLKKDIPAYVSADITGRMWKRLYGIIGSTVGLSVHAGIYSVKIQRVDSTHCRHHLGSIPEDIAIAQELMLSALDEVEFWSTRHYDLEFASLPSTRATSAWITADASCFKYSGIVSSLPSFRVEDFFTPDEVFRNDHNAMECLGIVRTALAFLRHLDRDWQTCFEDRLCPMRLTLRSDNSTTVAMIRKQRSKCIEVVEHTRPLMLLAAELGVQLDPYYLEKKEMDQTTCDDRSRELSTIWEWSLAGRIYEELMEDLAGLDPMDPRIIDMFASCSTSKSATFVSFRDDHDNLWTNAMSQSWDPGINDLIPAGAMLYLFPPARLVPDVLAKVRHECSGRDVFVLVVLPLFRKIKLSIFEELLVGYPMTWGGGSRALVPPESRSVNGIRESEFSFLAGILSVPHGLLKGFRSSQSTRRSRRTGKTVARAWTVRGTGGPPSSTAKDTIRRILDESR